MIVGNDNINNNNILYQWQDINACNQDTLIDARPNDTPNKL